MSKQRKLDENGNFIKAREEVKNLLTEVKGILTLNKQNLHIQRRKDSKNIDSMTELGISKNEAADILIQLDIKNYCWSSYDRNYPNKDDEVLDIFGKFFDYEGTSVELYIKIKVRKPKNMDKKVVCISFHRSEKALAYGYTE